MAVVHRPLLYLETSVFGFCFDEEPRNAIRREAALALFEQVRLGMPGAATSPLTFLELERTAEPLKSRLMVLLENVQIVEADEGEVRRLAAAYLDAQVIPREHLNDARHVASATVGKADVLVSLNLRHIANEWAERGIGAVNLREGYQVLRVRTPEEVLRYED
ncbi:type II toxin-antitoxin system VapC family toxin [candidate division WOR-3 bacterium]|nr:type II toxin-antitoxin system VapC family toxin [candidate division WOR-3 bacterium]